MKNKIIDLIYIYFLWLAQSLSLWQHMLFCIEKWYIITKKKRSCVGVHEHIMLP